MALVVNTIGDVILDDGRKVRGVLLLAESIEDLKRAGPLFGERVIMLREDDYLRRGITANPPKPSR